MYQILILCILSAVVFGNSDDTKYIDLLPEAEKEEFLNRIARRIIEEIQSKDSPEQSHTEVSDDQLNAHHAYVQDLIKEESENLRHEKRSINVTENVNRESKNYESEKDTPKTLENNQHIDLTLRNDKENNNSSKLSDDSYGVIPVKVVYDQENSESTQSPTTISGLSESTTIVEQNDIININNPDYSKSDTVIPSSLLSNGNEEKDKMTINPTTYTATTNTASTSSDSLTSEEKSDVMSNKDIQIVISDKRSTIHDSVQNSTLILSNTDTASTKVNNNNHDLDEKRERSTQMYLSSNQNKETEVNSLKDSNLPLDIDTTLMPLTTEKYTKYKLSTQSPVVYVTVQSTTSNSDITSKINRENIVHNVEKPGEVEITKYVKNNVAKKHLRTRLEVSQEYNFEGQGSRENDDEGNKHKNKNLKQYFVFEVPPEKPIYVEEEKKKENKQPYIVPIYNFAPENAYYNPYNNFGVNNDEEEEVIRQQAHKNNEELFDEELFLRSGFKIDLDSRKNKKILNEWMKHPQHSHWEHVLQSKLEYNPYFIQNENNEYLKRKSVRGNNLRQSSYSKGKDHELPDLTKIPDEIIYEPLRKYIEHDYDDNEGHQEKVKGKEISDPFTTVSDNDHVKAVKQFLILDKKYLNRPVPMKYRYRHIRPHARVLNENTDSKLKKIKKPIKLKNPLNFELDYYFGEHGADRTDKISNKDYDIEYETDYEHFYDLNAENRKRNVKSHLMEAKDDFDNYSEALVKVLKDMIYRDRVDLINYDWLLSTVDLNSALKKLVELTESIEKGNKIHPLDLKLLTYVVYLYNTSSLKLKNTLQSKQYSKIVNINTTVKNFLSLFRRKIILPKSKKGKGGNKSNHVYPWYQYYVRDNLYTKTIKSQELRRFKEFLNDLEHNLFELHEALKHIASITTYLKQNWYRDLKDIYLKSASKKQLLQVILHLAASRLFRSIEDTSKKAEEEELFTKNDGEEVRRIQEEFVFVLRILEQFKKTQ